MGTRSSSQLCPICKLGGADEAPTTGDYGAWRCKRCFEFEITGTAEITIRHLTDIQRYWISGQVRRSCELGRVTRVTADFVDQAKEYPLVRRPLLEGVDTYLRYLAEQAPSAFAELKPRISLDFAKLGFLTPQEMEDAQRASRELGFTSGESIVYLSVGGWQRADQLRGDPSHNRTAFMAMKFGDPAMDSVFASFVGGLSQVGYQLSKLDDRPAAGLIDDRLRVEIRKARFLVADLTHGNPGAYWEAGFAEGLGKPVIYTCEASVFKEKSTHFDTNHHLTIRWSLSALGDAVRDLKATVRATVPLEAKLHD